MHEERYKRHYKLVCIPARKLQTKASNMEHSSCSAALCNSYLPTALTVCTARCGAASDLETHTRTVITRQSPFRPLLARNDCVAMTAKSTLLLYATHLPQAEHSLRDKSGCRSSAPCNSCDTVKFNSNFSHDTLVVSQGKLQIQDIHELNVQAAAQVVSRKDTCRFAWLQSLALQLYAFCQVCWLHFHHLQKRDTSQLERTEQQW